jgi:hypothetical protein
MIVEETALSDGLYKRLIPARVTFSFSSYICDQYDIPHQDFHPPHNRSLSPGGRSDQDIQQLLTYRVSRLDFGSISY